jgi:hypothetical protein
MKPLVRGTKEFFSCNALQVYVESEIEDDKTTHTRITFEDLGGTQWAVEVDGYRVEPKQTLTLELCGGAERSVFTQAFGLAVKIMREAMKRAKTWHV